MKYHVSLKPGLPPVDAEVPDDMDRSVKGSLPLSSGTGREVTGAEATFLAMDPRYKALVIINAPPNPAVLPVPPPAAQALPEPGPVKPE